MPLIQFYATKLDYIKFGGLTEGKRLAIKENLRELFKSMVNEK